MAKRGLGSPPNYDPEKKKAVHRAGQSAMRAGGRAHRFDGDAAVAAGRRGGLARAGVDVSAVSDSELREAAEEAVRTGASLTATLLRRTRVA